MKNGISLIVWIVSLLALTGEPNGEKSTSYYVFYYMLFSTLFLTTSCILAKNVKNNTPSDGN